MSSPDRRAARPGSALRLRGAVALALIAPALLVAGRAGAACATEPPPKGLVERCHKKLFWVMETQSANMRRVSLDLALVEWMTSCVIAKRAPGLVNDAEESVDKMWDQIKDLSGSSRMVTIIPEYTPLEYTEGGKTCYGVKSVSFHIAGTQGTVEEEGPEDLKAGPTSDMVKEAAAAAIKAVEPRTSDPEIKRFRDVLVQMEKYGTDFDDTWYNVQPISTGDPFDSFACYKEFRTGQGNVCRSGDEALSACERHLAEQIVEPYHYYKVSQQRYAQILETIANDIQRGIDHLHQIQAADSPGALPCPSIKDVFMPKIAELAGKHSVYGAGRY